MTVTGSLKSLSLFNLNHFEHLFNFLEITVMLESHDRKKVSLHSLCTPYGLGASRLICRSLSSPVAILEIKKRGGHCRAMEKVGGQHKRLSCMVIFRCFDD